MAAQRLAGELLPFLAVGFCRAPRACRENHDEWNVPKKTIKVAYNDLCRRVHPGESAATLFANLEDGKLKPVFRSAIHADTSGDLSLPSVRFPELA